MTVDESIEVDKPSEWGLIGLLVQVAMAIVRAISAKVQNVVNWALISTTHFCYYIQETHRGSVAYCDQCDTMVTMLDCYNNEGRCPVFVTNEFGCAT